MRARDLGIAPGRFSTGPLNAITDVAGVTVGHRTSIQGDNIRTGVTVVVPHPGNVFQEKTPAAVAVGNGFGKFSGVSQIQELGEIETPIALTNTLSVPEVAAGLIRWTLAQPGNEAVCSVNPVVGETNDSWVNDIRARAICENDCLAAIAAASAGPVEEGSVGAGTGTQAFGWKGGIGTSSRMLSVGEAEYTVGVLVQTNYDGRLTIMGVGLDSPRAADSSRATNVDGSVIVVIATDAPLSDRNLRRLASRAFLGIGRTGSSMANGSGDFAIAFSSAESVRRTPLATQQTRYTVDLANDAMSPLFDAVVDGTEEAVCNALVAAKPINSRIGSLPKLPIESIRAALAR